MKSLKFVLVVAVLAVPLSGMTLPASAASAHNSQAGASGPTSNNSARTYRHIRRKTSR